MQLAPEKKKELTYLKGEVARVLADYSIKLERFEIETLMMMYSFIDDVFLDKVNDKRASLEDIMYARFMEFEIILKASKSKEIKKVLKCVKEI